MGGGGDFSGGVGSLSVGTGHEERGGCDDEGTGDRKGGGGGVKAIKHDCCGGGDRGGDRNPPRRWATGAKYAMRGPKG